MPRKRKLPFLLRCRAGCRGVTIPSPGGLWQCGACGSVDMLQCHTHEGPLPGMRLVQCTGEAHSNPYVDNCMLCAPRWGLIEIPEQFKTLEEYRAAQREQHD